MTPPPPSNTVSTLVDEWAEQIRLVPVDTVTTTLRPDADVTLYVETECDHRAREQRHLYGAEAARAAAGFARRVAETSVGHDEVIADVGAQRRLRTQALETLLLARSLSGFRHRKPKACVLYYGVLALLLGGDWAGQVGAALSFGEDWLTAVPQAMATSAATFAAGMVGTEVRTLRDSYRRAAAAGDTVPDAAVGCPQFFTQPDGGLAFVKIMAGVGVVTGLCVAAAIYGLRAATDTTGSGAGIVYGLLAAGFGLASAINSYTYADEIADCIDAAEADYVRELARGHRLSEHHLITDHEAAAVDAAWTDTEYHERGQAAAAHLHALKHRILANNPGVAGHGTTHSGEAGDE